VNSKVPRAICAGTLPRSGWFFLDKILGGRKVKSVKRKFITALIVSGLLVFALGCQKAPEKPTLSEMKPKLSEIFKTQLIQYLKDGGKLSTQSGEGINVLTLKSQLTDAKATFDLVDATWPSEFCPDARELFKKSHEGYELAIKLWDSKLNDKDEPIEPDINGWARYQNFAGGALVVKTYSLDFLVEAYRGKKYLPFDEDISVLLTLSYSAPGKLDRWFRW
jgi:hypothetical protein